MNYLLKPTTFFSIACVYFLLTLQAYSQEKSQYPMVSKKLMQAEITTVDGNRFKLADLKGKVILVNLWATWCGPCVSEMPYLAELQKGHTRETFEIIGLNAGDSYGKTEENRIMKLFGGKLNVNYTLATATKDVLFEFSSITKMSVVPQTILIDSEGYLRGVFIGTSSKVRNSMEANIAMVTKKN